MIKELIIWIKLFFWLRSEKKWRQKNNLPIKNINEYSKGLADASSRAFGYEFRRSGSLKFVVELLFHEIEVYHIQYNKGWLYGGSDKPARWPMEKCKLDVTDNEFAIKEVEGEGFTWKTIPNKS